nr:GNAT family N-acetyltransferase [Leifsonia sp. Leaf325]
MITATPRLMLTPLSLDDLDDVFSVYGDTGTWFHLPSGRHQSPEASQRFIERQIESWQTAGLGHWAVRLHRSGSPGSTEAQFVGTAGMTMTPAGVWNLGYRLAPAAWGQGYATELAETAMQAARDLAPQTPVTGRVLSINPASSRVLERVGLDLLWEGEPGPGVVVLSDPPTLRRIYADRPLAAKAWAWLLENA